MRGGCSPARSHVGLDDLRVAGDFGVGTLGQDLAAVREVYARPFNAVVAILLFLVAFRHLELGLQVVIEDYVHGKAARTAALIANKLLCWTFALVGVFAVAKIAFSA